MASNIKCKRLEGKVAIVTAATAGIGRATAERLASEGAKVFLCSRRRDAVEKAVAELTAKGYTVGGCACHVGSKEQRKRFIEEAVKAYGKIDILVSNAAVSPAATPISKTSEEAINKILDINIKSAVMLVQETLPHMSGPGASITLISSITAYNPQHPIGMYAVSKTALLGLAKGLAAELGPQGIRVNGVAPGFVPTKLSAYLVQRPDLARQQAEATHLRRLGTANDMAAAVAYLASDDASYVTGETLVVAGGMPSKL